MSALIDADDATGDLFVYDTDVSAAVQPDPFPEVPKVRATVVKVQKAANTNSGQPNLRVTLRIDPTDYPADYSVENAPEGVALMYFSQDLGNNKVGTWNMKVLCDKFGVSSAQPIDTNRFVNKEVFIATKHRLVNGETRCNVQDVFPA